MAKGDMPNAMAGVGMQPSERMMGFGQPANSLFPGPRNPSGPGGTMSSSVPGSGPYGGDFTPTAQRPMGTMPSQNSYQNMMQAFLGMLGQLRPQVQSNKQMEVPGGPGTIAPSGQQYNMLMDRYRNRQA